MEMSGLLMRRAAWVTALGLAVALCAALWQARSNVRDEGVGAARAAEMMAHLSALQADAETSAGARVHLEALQRLNASPELRHLQLRLVDGHGRVLVAPAGPPPSSPRLLRWAREQWQALTVRPPRTWQIPRADGPPWQASLQWDPYSEQREAFDDIVGMLALLVAFSAMLLCGICWAVRRALAPLQDIVHAIARYERHDYAHRLPPMPTRELDVIARALDHLAGALANTQAVRRSLSLKVLTLQEQERARLARELHDEFGQVLTAMRADTAYLQRKTRDDPALCAVAQDLANHCERIQLEVRDLLQRLRPQGLLGGGGPVPLERMLEELVQSWRDQPPLADAEAPTCFRLHVDLGDAVLPDGLALSLYRMTQEALTNAVRHAHAAEVSVTLVATADGSLRWTVEDDGVGLAQGAAGHRGHGLDGLRERVWAHGGEINIGPARTGGIDIGSARTGEVDIGLARKGGIDIGPVRTGEVDIGPARTSGIHIGSARTGDVDIGPARTNEINIGPARTGDIRPAGPGRPGLRLAACFDAAAGTVGAAALLPATDGSLGEG